MKVWRWAVGGLAACVAIGAAAVWSTAARPGPGQVVVAAKTPYSQGLYFAYAQPWGGERSALTRWWAPHADTIAVDLKRFPDNTTTHWRWLPFSPRSGPGVWSYQAVMHGNYDGGEPEEAIPPARVNAVRRFSQDFAWSIDNRYGDANVLTEFYLRSSPTDPDAKLLEVGWLLHAPAHSRRYFEAAQLVGRYTDPQGRAWEVRRDGKFCMFAPQIPGDVTSGTIDMRAALAWLQRTGTIRGDEWLWGVAFGSEAIKGIGGLSISHWSVAREQ